MGKVFQPTETFMLSPFHSIFAFPFCGLHPIMMTPMMAVARLLSSLDFTTELNFSRLQLREFSLGKTFFSERSKDESWLGKSF